MAQSARQKTRQQIEAELLATVARGNAEYRAATADEREAALARFQDALQKLNSFVLDGKVPNED